MKKIVSAILAVAFIACVTLPEKQAEAQVVLYSNRCCDSNLLIRCIINPSAPVGYGCWCYGQGAGVVC